MKIYQAYMNTQQRDFVCQQAIPFDASANSAPDTREYELFKMIHADPSLRDGDEPWGLVSWKFEHKSPVSLGEFHDFCRSAFASGADCAFINPMIGNEAVYANVWEQGIHCAHTGIEKVAYFLEEKMGIHVASVSDVSTFAFCNYFVATPRFWARYFEFIDAALGLLDAEAGDLKMRSTYGLSEEYRNKGIVLKDDPVVEAAFAGEAVVLDDMRVDERVQYKEATIKEGLVSQLTVAMIFRDQPIVVAPVTSATYPAPTTTPPKACAKRCGASRSGIGCGFTMPSGFTTPR